MEALPFHDNSDNDEEENGDNQDRKNEDKLRKEICDYEPVKIVGLWFQDRTPADDDEELTITKFKAHAAYKKKEYEKALLMYERCNELLPPNANLVLREVGESKARCLFNLAKFEDCEKILLKLVEEKGNPQDSSLQSMLADVYLALGKLDDVATNLKHCFELHPEYSDYWNKVSDLFAQLAKSAKYFLEHCKAQEGVELDSLSDIWYFVGLLKDSCIKENFLGDIQEDSMLLAKDGLKFSDGQVHEEFNMVEEKFKVTSDRKVAEGLLKKSSIDLVEFILKNPHNLSLESSTDVLKGIFKDLNGSSTKFIEFRNKLLENKTCPCFEIGLLNSYPDGYMELFNHQKNSSPSKEKSFIRLLMSETDCSEDKRLLILHSLCWQHVMNLMQYFAVSKAQQLLQKTVQYSKGFAKEMEQRKLSQELKLENAIESTDSDCPAVETAMERPQTNRDAGD